MSAMTVRPSALTSTSLARFGTRVLAVGRRFATSYPVTWDSRGFHDVAASTVPSSLRSRVFPPSPTSVDGWMKPAKRDGIVAVVDVGIVYVSDVSSAPRVAG